MSKETEAKASQDIRSIEPTEAATTQLNAQGIGDGDFKENGQSKPQHAVHCSVCTSMIKPAGADESIQGTARSPGLMPAPNLSRASQNPKNSEKAMSSCTSNGFEAGAEASKNEEQLSFIGLACTKRCKNHEKDAKKKPADEGPSDGDGNSDAGGVIYYCVPDCFEHFLQYQWGLYSGLGQAHKLWPRGLLGNGCGKCHSDLKVVQGLSLEKALEKLSPRILTKGLSIFHTTIVESQKEQGVDEGPLSNPLDESESETVRRITEELEDLRVLKCPSCRYKIAIPDDRGCDAAWCEHCARALCLFCLTDCGDHPKTDPTARFAYLIGDAHDHVLNNDCGLTGGRGVMHSGKLLARHHDRQFLKRASLRLKRVPEAVRKQVCNRLNIPEDSLEDIISSFHDEAKNKKSLFEMCREVENDKWEHYRQDMRASLLHAAYRGDVIQTRSLLEAGVPQSIPDSKGGETALHYAAVKGHLPVVELLLEWGANPWQISPQGRTPLDDLCNIESSGDLETARCLIRACMQAAPATSSQTVLYPWERPWPNGTTAHECARRHHPGSPVNAYFQSLRGFQGRLAIACTSGHTSQVKQLLSNTSRTFPQPSPPCPSLRDLPPAEDLIWIYNSGSGCTALLDLCAKSTKLTPQHLMSCTKVILDAAKSLGKRTCTIEKLLQMRDIKYKATALHWLALDTRPEIMKVAGLLLRYNGSEGELLKAVDKRCLTPLEWAKNHIPPTAHDMDTEDWVKEKQQNVRRWEALDMALGGDATDDVSLVVDVPTPGE